MFFKYKVINTKDLSSTNIKHYEKKLNELGAKGYELVANQISRIIFMKRINEKPEAEKVKMIEGEILTGVITINQLVKYIKLKTLLNTDQDVASSLGIPITRLKAWKRRNYFVQEIWYRWFDDKDMAELKTHFQKIHAIDVFV